MKPFSYAKPKNLDEVVAALQRGPNVALLAGGTDLLSLMKDHVEEPETLVDLKAVPGLNSIEQSGKGFKIGALVTMEQLRGHATAAKQYPALVQAVEGIASPQIRNRGTVGGDLCQRPRCWYYRNGFGLLAVQNGSSMVRDGDNRYHAILGNSGEALFVSPSSLAPALIALQAQVVIRGKNGERVVNVADFFRTPSSRQEREHALEAAEFVTGVLLPDSPGVVSATYEVRQKEALDWPLAAASVALTLNGDRVRNARIVLGHVAPVPWIATQAASSLNGKALDESSAEEAGKAAVEGAQALSRNGYKIRLARVAVKRALLRAAGREV